MNWTGCDMKTSSLIATSLQDYAEYYFSKCMNVCPYYGGKLDWNEWKYKDQKKEDIESYTWNTFEGVSLVVGKKGIRALKFMNIEDMDIMKVCVIIKEALDILYLPEDYPWVVLTSSSISIIVESPDDIQGMRNKSYPGRKDFKIGHTILLWQELLTLPTTNPRIHFLSSFPDERPMHVTNTKIFKCLDHFREKDDIEDSKTMMMALGI